MSINNTKGAVLITGSAKRIGAELCRFFANQGYDVAIHYYQSKDEAFALKEEILSTTQVRCESFKADLINIQEGVSLIEKVFESFPHLNFLINSASQFYPKAFHELSIEDWDRNMALHVKAPFFLSKYFIEQCKGPGQIINFTDSDLKHHMPKEFLYGLSKHTLKSLTERLAEFAGPQNIRVNAIAPGWILSAAHENQEDLAAYKDKTPLNRPGEVGSLMKAVDYLINNEYVTGQTLYVDGGRHLVQ